MPARLLCRQCRDRVVRPLPGRPVPGRLRPDHVQAVHPRLLLRSRHREADPLPRRHRLQRYRPLLGRPVRPGRRGLLGAPWLGPSQECSLGFYCPGAAEDTVNAVPGSKPIIMPVGGSTETQEVEVVEKEMTLDVDCADFDADAIKAELAAQYGVDAALITLDIPAGVCRRSRARARALVAITFTVEIATSGTGADGEPISVDTADLVAAVETVDDGQLGSALGAALGATVTVASTNVTLATVTKTIALDCPKGKWCTAGLIVPCPVDTYNNLTGQDFATACELCPANSHTEAEASTAPRLHLRQASTTALLA